MIFRLLKYSILFLIILNFPGWVLVNFNPVLSSALSYLSFGLIMLYFILVKNWKLNVWMILFGCTYFGISSVVDQQYMPDLTNYIIIISKYFILIIGGYGIAQDTSKKELFIFLLIGAMSVFLQMFVFYNPLKDYGRYSGFYLNPNSLGFICMMGYALTYSLERKWRILGQIAFTFIGFLTFSRTFIVIWLVMNLFSIRLSIKNIRILVVGLLLFIGLLTFNSFLPKSNPRLDAMSNILEGKTNNTSKLQEDSRTQTWAVYYPALMEKPFFGHGYSAFDGGAKVSKMGPHNAFIKTMGEGGIITLLLMLSFYLLMLIKAWANFIEEPHLFLMTIALLLFMTTNHSYWTNEYLLFFSLWLQYRVFVVLTKHKNISLS